MPTLDVHNINNEKVGSIDLADAVFGAALRTDVAVSSSSSSSSTHQ